MQCPGVGHTCGSGGWLLNTLPCMPMLHSQSARRYKQVTELANGGELFDHIVARGHYTEPDAREITTQVRM